MELYKTMGPPLKQYLTGLRPAQMEVLESGFNEVDGVTPGQHSNETKEPKSTIQTNINPGGVGGKKGGAKGAKKEEVTPTVGGA